jgi:hypothetical protein
MIVNTATKAILITPSRLIIDAVTSGTAGPEGPPIRVCGLTSGRAVTRRDGSLTADHAARPAPSTRIDAVALSVVDGQVRTERAGTEDR